MGTKPEMQRSQAKSQEQGLLQTLEQDYHCAPRVAEAILADAQAYLLGDAGEQRAGQIRKLLVRRGERHGQAVSAVRKVAVVWTVDGGLEDQQVQAAHGRTALRQVRILRLLDEAVAQGGVATQEDLAEVLHVTVRTIKRDFAVLQAAGYALPSRGHLQGIGRGQSHKAQIVARWLRGETYDQIARETHHAIVSIQRYLRYFVQVLLLQRQGCTPPETAQALHIGLPLVRDYLAMAAQTTDPACQTRLAEQLQRFAQAEKGGQ